MAVKDALLAFLAAGPRHGYQLKAEFDDATGQAWTLNIGQVYTTLQRLERDDLVALDGSPDDAGRQAYRLLPAGRDALAAWLESPTPSEPQTRDEVTMRVLIAAAADLDHALAIIRQQRIAAMEHLQALTARKVAASGADLPTRLHLDRIVLLAESEIRWLDMAEQRLEAALDNTSTTGKDELA